MKTNPVRKAVLEAVAERIIALRSDHVVRVAIDGVDGAGKTIFADELAVLIELRGRPVIRASVDSFHNPRAVRYRLGRHSPEGFFRESYNYPLLKSLLLDTISPGGSGQYRRAAFDVATDSPVTAPVESIQVGAVLVFDGIFLHRPDLRQYWDLSIFLDVRFDVSAPRGAQRGTTSPDIHAPENRRYIEGQRLYLRECEPKRHATFVINNDALDAPYLESR